MADHGAVKKKFEPREVVVGAIAEFGSPDVFLDAARKVRDAGYTKWECYAPFPVHHMEEAMGARKTILPYVSAVCACVGLTVAFLLQWWTNGIDYQFWISGKEFFALPSSMPVMFELTILFTAIGTFLSMFLLSDLPLLSNPLFRNERFRQGATNDRFFIAVEAADPKYAKGKTIEFLRNLRAEHVEDFSVKSEPTALPKPFALVAVVLLILAMVPPIVILRERSTFHPDPKIHPVLDMDFQPKKKTQRTSEIFADFRASRPDVEGTVARGELELDIHFYEGIDRSADSVAENAVFKQPAGEEPAEAEEPAAEAPAAEPPAAEGPAAEPQAAGEPAAGDAPVDNTPWAKTFPAGLSERFGGGEEGWTKLIQRGEQRYNIYCSTCHGLIGDGDGLISMRALALQQPTWIKPLSLHDKAVVDQPVGKTFGTITNGIRRMPGYGAQITPEDRWAIVAYVKALQRSRSASPDDVPDSERARLQKMTFSK